MQRHISRPYSKLVMPLLTTWSNDSHGCGVSTILGYKWKGGRREFLQSFGYLESHILYALQDAWKWEHNASFPFKLNSWFANFFFKMTMLHNVKPILQKDKRFNPLISLWKKNVGFVILNYKYWNTLHWSRLL
jgi:hypothetical protein